MSKLQNVDIAIESPWCEYNIFVTNFKNAKEKAYDL
jgi:hypothetical protein